MKTSKNGVSTTQDTILTVEKAAQILGITERTLSEKLRSGEIKGYKKNRQWYCLYNDLVEYIKS